ncbi:exopolysaccharide biosynthesis polyprenyl glycosylphosphotransferase family protein [Sphingomonas sp. S17]|uniref:Exopolysaccharide biosynthesis polyprenyl glycosylphosphotransferase n=2 Tax=Sphingomonas paucimobilis TaxID=13689 RepID=A0A411LN08_SPHPI|nr:MULTISPECIES: exopolysaccharide biosynthesis polyprenyl glycosylphosphotransferase [Sphingomonas]EGI55753.1 exopolysaccharide biosynthesis polyprenyl glycosylphosphotransferase family protein [Sphingomonas sp. S17]MBQ1478552.1 exopolysaccharide biosynthesis polyprenyl glycosylphosphotransferase [Sphingomonas sp.]MCM3679601.1 exopolysaccharide biosynthesis polyprenyl glycosylphosphotransferase [Sphingomonas paucimobilis]MDG5971005.1 exopolysaccharide biosynthesis polyprenyl glycosylphosphotra
MIRRPNYSGPKGALVQYVSFSRVDDEPLAGAGKRTATRALRLRFYAAILILDALAVILGIGLASYLRFDAALSPEAITLTAGLIPLFCFLDLGNLRPDYLNDWRRSILSMVIALAKAVLLLLFFGFILHAIGQASRLLFGYGMALTLGIAIVLRAVIVTMSSKIFRGGAVNHVLLLDGVSMDLPAGPAGQSVMEVERIDANDFNDPYLLDQLARRFADVDQLSVACRPERRRDWAMALKGISVRADILIPELDELGSVGQALVAGSSTILVSTNPLSPYDRIVKRGVDVLLAAIALAFLAPLLLVVAVAVKLDSRGPVFFRQQRVGYGNRLFLMYKFRSMRVETSDLKGGRSASRDDDRITRVGRIIRATSIDELPQLLNVLRGEMSVVGPRPHALGSLAGDQLFWHVDARYHHRHACKPGLTGLAQVRGLRGATHKREDLVSRLQADLEYLNNWSIWRDILIMLSTVRVIVHRNAY